MDGDAGGQSGCPMNRTDRLVAIVMHLQGRRLVRAEELAVKFEVSLRTIYRDMAALGEAGVPILGEAGVGYSLVRGYHLPPVMLTAEEAGALLVGGELVRRFTDASLCAASDAALDKLRAVLPAERRDHLERLARGVAVEGPASGPSAQAARARQAFLVPVQRAVAERRVLRMDYRAKGRETDSRRDVEALGVVFYGEAWYLVAWCRLRDELRHFRVDRIRSIDTLDETFPSRADFSLEDHLADRTQGGQTFPAKVWIADEALERAQRESYATLEFGVRRDGGVECVLFTWCYDWLARWLLSFGDGVEALEPEELRGRIREQAERALARHAEAVGA